MQKNISTIKDIIAVRKKLEAEFVCCFIYGRQFERLKDLAIKINNIQEVIKVLIKKKEREGFTAGRWPVGGTKSIKETGKGEIIVTGGFSQRTCPVKINVETETFEDSPVQYDGLINHYSNTPFYFNKKVGSKVKINEIPINDSFNNCSQL